MASPDVPNATILKNKGYPVKIHRLDETGQRVFNAAEEPVLDIFWVRFTNTDLATMEEDQPTGWGNLENWEAALNDQPYLTLNRTFAILCNMFTVDSDGTLSPEYRKAGLLLQDGQSHVYTTVLTGALLMAQGVDPETAGEVIRQGLKAVTDELGAKSGDILTNLTEATSPGSNGSTDGQNSEETSTSSGD